MSTAQLELRPVRESEDERLERELRGLVREIVNACGVKECAYQLDCAPNLFLNAVEGRGGNALHMAWLPWLVMHAPDTRLLEWLASLRGMELRRAKPITPEERLTALESVLRESLGPDLLRAVAERVKGKLAERGE